MSQAAESLQQDLQEVADALSAADAFSRGLVAVRCPACRRVASAQEGVPVEGQTIALLIRSGDGWQLARSHPDGHYLPTDRFDVAPGAIFGMECRRRHHRYRVPATYLARMADSARESGHGDIYLRDNQAGVDPTAIEVEPWNESTYLPRPPTGAD